MANITMNRISELKRSMLNCNVFSVYDYDCLSMQELLCTFFDKINQCVDVSNKTVVLAEWLVSQGLQEEVAKKLETWLIDGTLANIINDTVFKELNNKIKVNSQNIDGLKNKIDGHIQASGTKFNTIEHKLDTYVFSDSYPTLQEAHDAVVAKGGGTLVINKDYTLNRGFKWDCSKVIIDGCSKTLTLADGISNTSVIIVQSSETLGKPYYQADIEVRNLNIISNNESEGIYFNSNDPNKALSHITFRNCSIQKCRTNTMSNSTYLVKFVDCDIFNNKGVLTISSNATDTGENIQFRGCAIYNNTGGFKIYNGNVDLFFTNCSIDYNEVNSIFEITNGKVFINSCHIEHNANGIFTTTVPFVVKGDAGQLFIDNSLIMFSHPNQTTMSNIFFAQGGNSTITLTNNFLFGCKTTSGYLCGGDGRMIMKNNRVNIVPECSLAIHPENTSCAVGSMRMNRLVDIYLTEDGQAITGITTQGTNGNISIDTNKYLKHGKSIKVTKTTGGGSPFAIRAVFPIDRMSINNVRIALAKASGDGPINVDFGYCVPNNGQDYEESKGAQAVDLPSGGTWTTIEKTMMTAPTWATHGYVNIATSSANNIVFNIGEIVSNSI